MTLQTSRARIALAATALLLSAGAAVADDSALPAICRAAAPSSMAMGAMEVGAPAGGAPLDAAHQDLMRGMGTMDAQMMEGMQAQNLDVAFVCGMIPHHQGAIDMAQAELAHGADPFARALAQDIIAAQQAQIDQMRAWLARQPQ